MQQEAEEKRAASANAPATNNDTPPRPTETVGWRRILSRGQKKHATRKEEGKNQTPPTRRAQEPEGFVTDTAIAPEKRMDSGQQTPRVSSYGSVSSLKSRFSRKGKPEETA